MKKKPVKVKFWAWRERTANLSSSRVDIPLWEFDQIGVGHDFLNEGYLLLTGFRDFCLATPNTFNLPNVNPITIMAT